ncbi:hypothetical protein [Aneurinibacillus aneurinilyticus]|uniref:hypothetical protein n=1 Tax=Aneurinibacillus aneurinilyticus TaxID=1391 RepID=UPI0035233633
MNQKTGLLDEMMKFLIQRKSLTYKDVYTAVDILILCPEWEQEQAWDILKAVVRRYETTPEYDWYAETRDFFEDLRIMLDRLERPDDLDLYDAITALMICQKPEDKEAWNIMRAIVYRYENEPIVSEHDDVEYYDGYSVLVG